MSVFLLTCSRRSNTNVIMWLLDPHAAAKTTDRPLHPKATSAGQLVDYVTHLPCHTVIVATHAGQAYM